MNYFLPLLIFASLTLACNDDDDTLVTNDDMYFPDARGSSWETLNPASLGWDQGDLELFYSYLEDNNTRAFMVLKNGRIVIEKYWGSNLSNTAPFGAETKWYWASAGKALTATLVGIAQQEGHLRLDDKSADYLGDGWTSMSKAREELITIRHQLSMTTGINYQVPDPNCTEAVCLTYNSDPGTQWFYHNAPYSLLSEVVGNATATDYNQYTEQKIGSLIGMNGRWINTNYNNIYWSSARDMARFGLLILNRGVWNGMPILSDNNYFEQMVRPSQQLNPSYGYLWWLNGRQNIILPGMPASFDIPLSEHAPSDLFAGIGKNGQFVEVIPSQQLVVVRMGEAPDGSLVPITFHDEMWKMLSAIVR